MPPLESGGRRAAPSVSASGTFLTRPCRSESVFFRLNRREADAPCQVTVFQGGRDFDLNMFLLLLLDKTSCRLASDPTCRINLSVRVAKKGPFVFSVRFLAKSWTFSNRFRLKIQEIKEK